MKIGDIRGEVFFVSRINFGMDSFILHTAAAIIRHTSKNISFEESHDNADVTIQTCNLWAPENTADFKVKLPLRVQPHEITSVARRAPRSDITKRDQDMDNQPALPPPPGQKYRSDAIGFVVIFIHFVAAYFMTINFSYELNLKYYIGLILLTPGYVLSFLIDASPRMSDFIYGSASDTFLKFFFITFSSFFYGITVSFLVSKPMLKRSVGIILTILLILSSCYLIMLVARLAA